MSHFEVIILAAWLALLAVGLWLMFSPIRAAQDTEARASERREPVFHGLGGRRGGGPIGRFLCGFVDDGIEQRDRHAINAPKHIKGRC